MSDRKFGPVDARVHAANLVVQAAGSGFWLRKNWDENSPTGGLAELIVAEATPLADWLLGADSPQPEAILLLHRLVEADDSPCILDHHGQCQEHGLHLPPCPVPLARKLLGLQRDVVTP